jgi:hypothetical protein
MISKNRTSPKSQQSVHDRQLLLKTSVITTTIVVQELKFLTISEERKERPTDNNRYHVRLILTDD